MTAWKSRNSSHYCDRWGELVRFGERASQHALLHCGERRPQSAHSIFFLRSFFVVVHPCSEGKSILQSYRLVDIQNPIFSMSPKTVLLKGAYKLFCQKDVGFGSLAVVGRTPSPPLNALLNLGNIDVTTLPCSTASM